MFYTVIRSGQFSAAEYLRAEHATFSALANRRERDLLRDSSNFVEACGAIRRPPNAIKVAFFN